LADLYEQSGSTSWPEFSLRFLYSQPQIKTVIVGTGKLSRLLENMSLAKQAQTMPLPPGMVKEIFKRQAVWSAARTFDPNHPTA
jgi:predicted aldo/keto reductase-like oxidoreductase